MQKSVLLAPYLLLICDGWGQSVLKGHLISHCHLGHCHMLTFKTMPTISMYASLPLVALSSCFNSLPATPIRPLKKLP